MHVEDGLSTPHVWRWDDHHSIEATRPQERRIEHIRPVRGRDDDDTDVIGKTIHFDQDLIESLLAFVIGVAESGAPLATNSVNFVDEDDARRAFAGFAEQIAHPTRPDADEHFYELGARDPEKWDACFTGHGARKEGLPRPRRTDQEYAARNSRAKLGELLRFL